MPQAYGRLCTHVANAYCARFGVDELVNGGGNQLVAHGN